MAQLRRDSMASDPGRATFRGRACCECLHIAQMKALSHSSCVHMSGELRHVHTPLRERWVGFGCLKLLGFIRHGQT